MGGRNGQRVREVVEAAVGGLVAGQERLDVEAARVEREQVADRVVVFGAIQPMNRGDSAGTGRCGPHAIDFTLQPARDHPVRRLIRPRAAGRRHRAGAKFGDDALPYLSVRGWLGDVERVQRETGGLETLVVAADAVRADDGARLCLLQPRHRRDGEADAKRNDGRTARHAGEQAPHGVTVSYENTYVNGVYNPRHEAPPHRDVSGDDGGD